MGTTLLARRIEAARAVRDTAAGITADTPEDAVRKMMERISTDPAYTRAFGKGSFRHGGGGGPDGRRYSYVQTPDGTRVTVNRGPDYPEPLVTINKPGLPERRFEAIGAPAATSEMVAGILAAMAAEGPQPGRRPPGFIARTIQSVAARFRDPGDTFSAAVRAGEDLRRASIAADRDFARRHSKLVNGMFAENRPGGSLENGVVAISGDGNGGGTIWIESDTSGGPDATCLRIEVRADGTAMARVEPNGEETQIPATMEAVKAWSETAMAGSSGPAFGR